MGGLSFRFKPCYLGLVNSLSNVYFYIIFFSLINLSFCIYEDQIGKFDWRHTYVGKIKFAQFDTVSTAKKIIVATEENVLAALNLKTGHVVWRHVLETASQGNIQMLHVSDKVVTVSGANPYLVRSWDTATGILLWEWSLMLQNAEGAELSQWWVQQGLLVHLLPVLGRHLEVTTYNLLTGQNRGATSKLPAVWANEGCVVTPPYYTCVSGNYGSQLLLSVDVTSNAVQIISSPLSTYVDWDIAIGKLREFDANSIIPGFIIDDKIMLTIKDNKFVNMEVKMKDPGATVTVLESSAGPLMLQAWQSDELFQLTAYNIATTEEVSEISVSDEELVIPEPQLAAAMCTKTSREPYTCRFMLIGADESTHVLQQGGRVSWTREEALAGIVAVEFVDLPVSELEAAIETEFDHKEGDVWGALARRLHTQAMQLATLLQGAGDARSDQALVRDYFHLHKVILAVTKVGKIFGIDNLSGNILWARYEPYLVTSSVAIYSRRSARHPPHGAYVTLVGSHQVTGNGMLVSLNPITGELIGEGVLHLDYRLLQTAILHRQDTEYLRGLILLDQHENVQVLPITSASLVQDVFLYVAERSTAKVQGYALQYDGKSVNVIKTWSIYLGGSASAGHEIVRIVPKHPAEQVHSPGKVMGDRSVLYKYINPNLVLFITEGSDPVHKDVVSATCVDVVSGALVAAQTHRRARATPHAVHSDNFLAYAYYSDKQRRTEMATMELYEGRTRSQPAGAAFSSLAESHAPLVERQSYILPATLAAAAITRTERAITDKHLLLSLSSGAILEMPWAYLDPRRPLTPTPEHREEGLIPYAPELPLPVESTVNYNRSLHRVHALHTAPSGLESTSLVLAYGLDIFYTRVAPSKTFDLLKDDFDYYLITIVLAALIAATYGTKYFASRKMLKQAWK